MKSYLKLFVFVIAKLFLISGANAQVGDFSEVKVSIEVADRYDVPPVKFSVPTNGQLAWRVLPKLRVHRAAIVESESNIACFLWGGRDSPSAASRIITRELPFDSIWGVAERLYCYDRTADVANDNVYSFFMENAQGNKDLVRIYQTEGEIYGILEGPEAPYSQLRRGMLMVGALDGPSITKTRLDTEPAEGGWDPVPICLLEYAPGRRIYLLPTIFSIVNDPTDISRIICFRRGTEPGREIQPPLL